MSTIALGIRATHWKYVKCLSMMGEIDWVPETGVWAGLYTASPGTAQNDGF